MAPPRAGSLLRLPIRPPQAPRHRRHVDRIRRGAPRPRPHPSRDPLPGWQAHRDALGGRPGRPRAGPIGHTAHTHHDERIRRVCGGDHRLRVPLPHPSIRHHRVRWAGAGTHGAGGHDARAGVGAPDERGVGLLRRGECGRARRVLRRLPRHARGRPLLAHQPRHCLRHDVPAPRRPDAVTTSSSASHRGRGHREPETRVAHRRGAAHRAEVQRGPDVEATAGQTPHGPEQTERGTAGVR